ncbi:MAG TPA: DUF4199 domain-containing protein [Novosphingobium sp.]|nr:DUF4199 domain-containing protein [Novosphingobium sp.]
MTRLILTYGMIAGTIELALLALSMGLVSDHGSLGMALGYLSMLIAMSLVFVGVKRFRDEHQGGVIRFGKAFLVGLGIAGIACLFYVIGWELYMWATDHRFMAEYMAKALAEKQASGASAADLAAFKAEMEGFAEMYRNPLLRMLITLSEIAPVGLLVPLISAAILRKSEVLPARA